MGALALAGLWAAHTVSPSTNPPRHTAPPYGRICGNASLLRAGPAAPPKRAVVIAAGDDSTTVIAHDWTIKPDTTYWFAPGTHTLGTGPYSQISPADGDKFIGAPGAVLDGNGKNRYAFTGTSSGVTIEYLTIQDFGIGSSATTPSGGNPGEGVVNHSAGHNWLIQYDTVRYNAGAGIFLGSGGVARYDCLTQNGQYGFQGAGGASNITLTHNEISYNNTWNWEAKYPGCGCSGGGKFWDVHGAKVTHNWVHDNHGPGLWADTDNTGFDIEDNYIANNEAEGVFYEISYNALIKGNTFVDNAWGMGHTPGSGFPAPALYLSESGSDPRVPGPYRTTLRVTGNKFIDNWSGVVLWENADRFCGSPANTSAGYCTLVSPSVTAKSCNAANISRPPYYGDCRWKTQNVLIDHNVFAFNPAHIGPSCTPARTCGFQGMFSQYGTSPDWSPYKGRVVENHITFAQNNHFADNTYRGPWRFIVHAQGNVVSWAKWRASPYHQDAGSTLRGGARAAQPQRG